MEKEIGKVTHYFGNLKVAVIKLKEKLQLGEEIKITGGEKEFSQKVSSMQIDHKEVKEGKKGDEVAIKVKEKVREGYKVWK